MFITEKKFITEKLSKYASQNIQIENMNNIKLFVFKNVLRWLYHVSSKYITKI